MHFVQYIELDGTRRVGEVAEGGSNILPFVGYSSTYELVIEAISKGISLTVLCASISRALATDYADIVEGGRLLAPVDHPEPARFWVTGTGLTHIGSADARDKMHHLEHGKSDDATDSMKIFQMGMQGGKPTTGETGSQPEWFFKGVGTCVVASEVDLDLPSFALAGGEEAEIVGLYVIGPNGDPWRIGFALGNEFSDQVTEAQNYLYLAHSKLRQCAIGPELLVGDLPEHVEGAIRVIRNGKAIWQGDFLSGESNMSHSIRNLEQHHFRYDMFRRPGDVHAYFFGAAELSCAHDVMAKPGDRFEIDVPIFGRPLRNTMVAAKKPNFNIRAL